MSSTSPNITLLIPNMHCPSCVESINSILSPVTSLRNLNVSLLVRSVTFQVDTAIGSSSKRKEPVKIEEDVKRLLELEGGFIVDSPHCTQEAWSSRSPPRKPRKNIALSRWFRRTAEQTAKEKEDERRSRHLAHCDVCQEEEANPSGAIDSPIDPSPIASAGVLRTTLSISGMTCASCVQAITSSLRADSRILSADVDLLSSSAVVRHHTKVSPEEVAGDIEDLGYGAEVVDSTSERSEPPPRYTEDHHDPHPTVLHTEVKNSAIKSTFSIEGMTCSSCSNAISTALRDIPGVDNINIDVIGNSATIQHSIAVAIADIINVIEEAGYGAKEVSSVPIDSSNVANGHKQADGRRTVHIAVEGTYCHKCITQLNDALAHIPIRMSKPFSLKDPSTKITYDSRDINIRQILSFLNGLAPEFEAHIVQARSVSERSREIQAREVRHLALHLAVAVLFAIPTFIIAIVGMILLPKGNGFRESLMKSVWGAANVATLVLWPLATVVQFGVGRIFYSRALTPLVRKIKLVWSLSRRRGDASHRSKVWTWRSFFNFGSMDLLVALSTSVAYFSSIAMLVIDVRSGPTSHSIGTYFDSSVFLIMFILVGRVLEAYAKSRTTDAVSLLGQLRPETALLVESVEGMPSAFDKAMLANGSASSLALMKPSDLDSEAPCKSSASPSDALLQGSQTRTIPVDHIERGDFILVPPGSFPPTDGVVIHGQTTFDESSLTGESRPVHKSPGDQIYTGTINLSSAITIQVTSLPSETMLDSIIGAVSNASTHKAPIEKLAERLTGVFVPIIVYLSLAVLAIWLSLALTGHLGRHGDSNGGEVFFAIEFAIATLVVACPCGIGLAVPCANAVGNGLAAKMGILASGGGEAFLAATQVGTVVMDKTGTLTEGNCQVTDERSFRVVSGEDAWALPLEDLQRAVMEIERGSTHPLAKGLVQHLEARLDGHAGGPDLHVISTEEISGRGLKAVVQISGLHFEVLVGSPGLLQDNRLELPLDPVDQAERWFNQAKSVILVAVRTKDKTASPDVATSSTCQSQPKPINDTKKTSNAQSSFDLVHGYALSDPPRSSALPVISDLQKRIKVMMLSGDSPRTAKAVAKMVGIPEENVIAGVGPLEKADVIKDLQRTPTAPYPSLRSVFLGKAQFWKRSVKTDTISTNRKIMFIGDGLNDAVALAAADVSVAMGHGSQAVLAGSDFVLLSSSLSAVPSLFALSRKVYNRQRLNLLWAIIFNLVCIPFAAGVFYPAGGLRLTPVWSAVLMALSSVSVVLSSLAMRWGL